MKKIITDEQINDVTKALLEIPVAGKYTHTIIKYLEQLPPAPVPVDKVDKKTEMEKTIELLQRESALATSLEKVQK